MIINSRSVPLKILLFRYLIARSELPSNDVKNYQTLEKGYQGELKSDQWIEESLTNEWLVLHDLLLEYNGSLFQIDTLIIAYEKIYILDVKNYEGDYFFDGDKWRTDYDPNLKNPLHQLERCETLLVKLLLSLGFNISVDSHLIFINPEFTLYTSSSNSKIILPTLLNRFMKKLNSRPVKLNSQYYQLAEKLLSLHIIETPYDKVPRYDYDQLKKGMLRPSCLKFFNVFSKRKLICGNCNNKDDNETAVLRGIKEFTLLFPDSKITTNVIFEWCGGIISKKAIRLILSNNYSLIEYGPSAHFVKS